MKIEGHEFRPEAEGGGVSNVLVKAVGCLALNHEPGLHSDSGCCLEMPARSTP